VSDPSSLEQLVEDALQADEIPRVMATVRHPVEDEGRIDESSGIESLTSDELSRALTRFKRHRSVVQVAEPAWIPRELAFGDEETDDG
jgi:hypothetical protein